MAAPSLVDKTMLPQSPFLEGDDQPIEVVIGPEDGEDVFEADIEVEQEPSFDANLAEYIDDSVLDNLQRLTDLDPGEMFASVASSGAQMREALQDELSCEVHDIAFIRAFDAELSSRCQRPIRGR